jgi:acyl-CoA dehydrogenase
MAIDFTFPPEVDEIRFKVRDFVEKVVRPIETKGDEESWGRDEWIKGIIEMRGEAKERGLWLPHMPKEWGGMGLGHVAMAAVSAEAARSRMGPFALNAQAPDEGNMHTLLHWGTDAQKEKYLRPLCEGVSRSCFAMTEPEVAGSDPTLIQTKAYPDGDEWVVNGHKWFISGAKGAKFAILIARTEDDPDLPQAANSAFLVDLPSDGWTIVRDIETMSGGHNHCEIRIEDLRLSNDAMLGGRGEGHLLGQYRLGPARLAHCMRWIGQAETALEMMVDRSLNRFSHGSILAEKQGIQWLIAESTIELYQAKLMVLHAASLIDAGPSGSRPCRRASARPPRRTRTPSGACSGRRAWPPPRAGPPRSGRRRRRAAARWRRPPGPSARSGRPHTTTSYTSGWCAIACSTSSAKIFSPPELIVTESRPSSSMMPSARETGAVAGHRVAHAVDDRERARRLLGVAEVAERHAPALASQPISSWPGSSTADRSSLTTHVRRRA